MLTVLCAAAAVLLLGSGVGKLRRPAGTATMLGSVLPALPRGLRRPLSRVGGAGEVVIGLAVLLPGGRAPLALLLAAYAVFAAVALRLVLSRAPVPCGCFGRTDAPVTAGHVVLDLAAAAAAAAALAAPSGALLGVADHGVLVAVTSLAQAAVLAVLAYLAVTALPELLTARRDLEAA